MLKLGAFIFVVLGALAALLWLSDVHIDHGFSVAVVAPAPLYSLPPHEYPRVNPVVATLPIGQALRVTSVRYGKDFEAMHVETPAGESGWVVGGEGVKVLSRGKQRAG